MKLAFLCAATCISLLTQQTAEAKETPNCDRDDRSPISFERGDLVKVPNSRDLNDGPEFGVVQEQNPQGVQIKVQSWKKKCSLEWLVGEANCYSHEVPIQKLVNYQPDKIERYCQNAPLLGLRSGEVVLLHPNSWRTQRVEFLGASSDETEVLFKTFKADGIDHHKALIGSIRVTDSSQNIGRRVNSYGQLNVGRKYLVTDTGLISQPMFEVVALEVYSNGYAVGRPLKKQDGIKDSVIFLFKNGRYVLDGFANLPKE